MSSLYQGGKFKPMPPVETAEDNQVLKAMFGHESIVLPDGEIAGNEGAPVQIRKKKTASSKSPSDTTCGFGLVVSYVADQPAHPAMVLQSTHA